MINDLRFALRAFARTPGFSVVAIVTLALGIGATTAMFSVVDAVLLRPLPFASPDRLVVGRGSLPDIRDVAASSQSFDGVGIWASNLYNLEADGGSRQVRGGVVSQNLFALLGVAPLMGRTFTVEDDRDDTVVLGYGLWQSMFGGDPGVLGRTVRLTAASYTIIGVAPPWFRFPSADFALWTSLGSAEAKVPSQSMNRSLRIFNMLGRLRSGVSVTQAASDVASISARLAHEYPQTNAAVQIALQPLTDRLVGDVRPSLMLLLGAVALLLLIACANVANLLVARTTVRTREMSIRTALGAGRARLARQLAVEHLVLALAGGTLGVLVAMWGVDVMPSVLEARLPRADGIRLDSTVLLFALGSTLLTALAFGIAPAVHAVVDNRDGLQGSGRSVSAHPRGRRIRQAIVIAEITLAVVVVVGAGLLTRSFVALIDRDPGFTPANLLTFNLQLVTLPDDATRARMLDAVLTRLGELPGIDSAGGSSGFPVVTAQRGTRFAIEGRSLTPGEDSAFFMAATPGYFKALGTAVERGRPFSSRDTSNAPPVVVINRTLANTLFAGQDPLGRRLRLMNPDRSDAWRTVVGVVGDLYYQGPASEAAPAIYTPFAQTPFLWAYVMVRTVGDPASMTSAIRDVMPSIDARLSAANIRPMREILSESVAEPRLTMRLTSSFAGLALLLAAVGIYGVVSYSVAQRTREIGIRRALGAGVGDVMRLVVGEGAVLGAVGVALGLGAAAGAMRWTAALLFGVTPRDPVTYAAVAITLLAIAGVASWIPARRALRIEPVAALRAE